MLDLAYTDVLRSLATASILTLRDLDPQIDYENLTPFVNPSNGRIHVEDEGQKLEAIYGGSGTYAPSGVIIEGFPVIEGSTPGRKQFRVILSVSRLIRLTSFEREQSILSALCQRNLKNFIYKVRECPVYSFNPVNVNATAIVGSISWPRTNRETIEERLTGDMNAGGSVSIEFEFVAQYAVVYNYA